MRDAPELLAEHGFESFELFTTERAAGDAELLVEAAGAVHFVPAGQVPETAAALLDASGSSRLVAFGGGRVIDTAKAVASVSGAEVAAIPTTLSGAEMTGIHRIPAGAEHRVNGLVRPSLVVADPAAMTGLPEPRLRASAMNALAHGADSLYTPVRQPRLADDRAARGGADRRGPGPEPRGPRPRRPGARRDPLRLRDRLGHVRHPPRHLPDAGPGLRQPARRDQRRHPAAGDGVHGAARAPAEIEALGAAIGTEPDRIEERILELGGRPPGLGSVGGDRGRLGEAVEAMLERPELGHTPGAPGAEELTVLIERAW